MKMTRSSTLATQCYSVELRGQILVKGYGHLSFANNMRETFGKNLSNKYSLKILDHANKIC